MHLLTPLQRGTDPLILLLGCVGLGIGLFIYLMPAIIGVLRNHRNMVLVILLNVFLGWTLVGWIATLIFSLVGPRGEDGRSIFFS